MFAYDGAMATDAEVRALEERLAAAVGTLNLATAAVVDLLAEAFVCGAWQVDGIRSREQWVMWQLGCSRSRATGLVALASRREELPSVVKRLDAGELSEDAATAIAKRVPADREAVTADIAPLLTHPQLRRALRHMQPEPAPEEPGVAPLPERRELSFFYDDNGCFHGRWCLPADEGAVVEAALRKVRDDVFHNGDDGVTWADALVALAGGGRDAFVVNLFVDADRPEAPTWLHLGPMLDRGMRRLHACDGSVRALLREKGHVVAKGRTTRTVGDTLRAIVLDRDGGCRYPVCTNDRWLDVHHVCTGRTADRRIPTTSSPSAGRTIEPTTAASSRSRAIPRNPTGCGSSLPPGGRSARRREQRHHRRLPTHLRAGSTRSGHPHPPSPWSGPWPDGCLG